ncbi:hypothetical protein K9M42_03215 [Patescibacteria group bacterium]|nr:hypothetical protein [Patescibacteria group bacterium]
MNRKVNKKEFVLSVNINGDEYYIYGLGKIYRDRKTIVRLTKNENSAQKLKNKKILDEKFFDLVNHKKIEFKINKNVVSNSEDLIPFKLKLLKEKIKEQEDKITCLKQELLKIDIKSENVDMLNSVNDICKKIISENKTLFKYKKEYVNTKFKLNTKKQNNVVELKIINSSFNFRYSKLKKLLNIENNE